MMRKRFPDNPFARASVGDVYFLKRYAVRHRFSDLYDMNGFNLLHYYAGSGLGRRDSEMNSWLAALCRLLIDGDVQPDQEVAFELPVFPAFLCASAGGNGEVMRLLLSNGVLRGERFHQALEHALEPHQWSGEPAPSS